MIDRATRRRLARQTAKQPHPNSPLGRALTFIDAFMELPLTAEIEIHSGHEEKTGEGAIGIKMQGKVHPFTLNEARDLANLLEETMNKFPGESHAFANTIMGIRAAVDRTPNHIIKKPPFETVTEEDL